MDDLYDFTCLWTELRALSDQRHARPGTHWLTVGRLIFAFARFLDAMQPDVETVAAVVRQASLSLEARIVPDEQWSPA